MDVKKYLNWIGCAVFGIILFAFAAVWVGFHFGDRSQFQSGNTSTGLCGSIPEPYKTIFDAAAQKFDMQPAFLAAIFLAGEHHRAKISETVWVHTFDPNTKWPNADGPWASSDVGASGPFQFMPATWAGHKAFARPNPEHPNGEPSVQDLWDSAFAAAHKLSTDGAKDMTTDTNKLRGVAGNYNGGGGWAGKEESISYADRVIGAFQYFQCTQLAGSGTTTGTWIWPVTGRISSVFGEIGPSHPKPHTGLDIAVSRGTPIKAVDGGVVSSVNLNPNNNCGVYIKIDHNPSLQSLYCHMIENSPTVIVGQKISQGQVIGEVDSTASPGHSTGNHLHLGAKLNNKFVDPMNYLPPQ